MTGSFMHGLIFSSDHLDDCQWAGEDKKNKTKKNKTI